jgi:hypothetical protein
MNYYYRFTLYQTSKYLKFYQLARILERVENYLILRNLVILLLINMRLILEPSDDIGIPITELDVGIDATPDHVISLLTMRYTNVDATKLVLIFNGRKLPYEVEILKLGLMDQSRVQVNFVKRSCCELL